MDHFMNPRNVGKIDDADGVGEVGNAKCGDIMNVSTADNDIITDVKFIHSVRLCHCDKLNRKPK